MLEEFKKFALRGNVIDLAVGVIIGGAFGKIVTSLVNDILMPVLGILIGGVNFTHLKYVIIPASGDIAEVAILYGAFIQSVVDFLIIAFSIFLFIKLLTSRRKKESEAAPASPVPTQEVLLLEEIRDILKSKHNGE
ncbi:MAG: large-conductance mechanosensitive channel protein MscL [Bacillota bacterium]|jgi:large conductance mechanosensitive channel